MGDGWRSFSVNNAVKVDLTESACVSGTDYSITQTSERQRESCFSSQFKKQQQMSLLGYESGMIDSYVGALNSD